MKDRTAGEIAAVPEIRAQIDAHIRKWYPQEACGLLLASDDGVRTVLADNLADKYHKLDPEAYPRTGENAYILNPLLIVNAEEGGERLVAIWHSHVRVGAYFSDEDVAQALMDGEPRYPGVDYVVFDAQDDAVKGFKVFTWDDAGQRFVERA